MSGKTALRILPRNISCVLDSWSGFSKRSAFLDSIKLNRLVQSTRSFQCVTGYGFSLLQCYYDASELPFRREFLCRK